MLQADSIDGRQRVAFYQTRYWASLYASQCFQPACRGRYAGSEFPQDSVQALDVALKHGTSLNPEFETVARAFFIRGQATKSIGNGAEVTTIPPSISLMYLASTCSCTVQCIYRIVSITSRNSVESSTLQLCGPLLNSAGGLLLNCIHGHILQQLHGA